MRLIDMTESQMRDYFNLLAETIEGVLPGEVSPGKGHNGRALFAIIVFDDPGVGQYVSNCSRENMVAALRETADRLEKRETIDRT